MLQVKKERAGFRAYLAPLSAALLAGLCLSTSSGHGATRTSSHLGSTATSIAGAPLPTLSSPPHNKFMIIYTLSNPNAGDISGIKSELISSFKKGQANEVEARKSFIEPSPQDESATESECEAQKVSCDVVRVKEQDWEERMTIELTVTPVPPEEHHHGPISSFLFSVCNARRDWPGCRDRRIVEIKEKLLGLERDHQSAR